MTKEYGSRTHGRRPDLKKINQIGKQADDVGFLAYK